MSIQFLCSKDYNEKIQEQINELFKELTEIQALDLKALLQGSSPAHIAICREQETIIAMATMVIYDVISGRKAWIEDVIVSQNFRQKGIGEKLIQTLTNKAKELNVSTILLYSNPKREAAHRLYKRLGFVPKESTLFMRNVLTT